MCRVTVQHKLVKDMERIPAALSFSNKAHILPVCSGLRKASEQCPIILFNPAVKQTRETLSDGPRAPSITYEEYVLWQPEPGAFLVWKLAVQETSRLQPERTLLHVLAQERWLEARPSAINGT